MRWVRRFTTPTWQVGVLLAVHRRWPHTWRGRIARYRLHVLGLHVMEGAQVGRIYLPHPLGIVIGDGVIVEDGAGIWQNVTLGVRTEAGVAAVEYPLIRAGAMIYSGAAVLGPVEVGEGAVVGANSVVLDDVPAGAVVVGAPAKPLR